MAKVTIKMDELRNAAPSVSSKSTTIRKGVMSNPSVIVRNEGEDDEFKTINYTHESQGNIRFTLAEFLRLKDAEENSLVDMTSEDAKFELPAQLEVIDMAPRTNTAGDEILASYHYAGYNAMLEAFRAGTAWDTPALILTGLSATAKNLKSQDKLDPVMDYTVE